MTNSTIQRNGDIQPIPFPESIKEWISERELVSLVLKAVDAIDDDDRDPHGLPRLFHAMQPKLLLAVLSYSYACGYYSSGEIESAVRKDNGLAYLAAGAFPDWNVLRRFRRLHRSAVKDCLKRVFRLALDRRARSVDYGPETRFTHNHRLTITTDFDVDSYLSQIADQRIQLAIQEDSATLDD